MKKIIPLILAFFSVVISIASNNKIDSLKNLLNSSRKDTMTLKNLDNLYNEYRKLNDYDNSVIYSNQAIDLLDNLIKSESEGSKQYLNKFKKEKAKAIHNIGAIYYNKGDYQNALKSFFSMLKLMEETTDKGGIAEASNNIGLVYEAIADYTQALKYSSDALKINQEMNNKIGVADCYSSIGNIMMYQGNYSEALEKHLTCLKIREEIRDKPGMEESYNNIGVIYTRQGNYPEALKNYFASLKISQEIGEKWDIALCYHNIGGIYQEQGNYNEALKNHFFGLKMSEELGDKSGMAGSYASIGAAYSKQGDYSKGLENLFSSLKISEEIGEERGAAEDCENIGEIYLDMGNYDKATGWLKNALVKADSIHHKDLIKEIYLNLSKTYLKRKDYQKAFEYHSLYSNMKDSLFNEANNRQIVEMKTKYETEKKENEIELLNKDKQLKDVEIAKQKNLKNGIIAGSTLLIIVSGIVFFFYKRRREAEMQYQIIDSRMKAMNAQLNQHFIFSSLSSIRNYMLVNVEQANDYLVRFARFVRSVLKHSDVPVISLKQELDELENYMVLEQFRFSNKFSYGINIAPEINSDELVVPPLIFQPIVENSIVHGFSGLDYEGHISIDISREDNRLVCKLSDNGKGLPKKSNAPAERKSFGMKLTKERIELFNRNHNQKALFELKELDQGVMVTITIPVSQTK